MENPETNEIQSAIEAGRTLAEAHLKVVEVTSHDGKRTVDVAILQDEKGGERLVILSEAQAAADKRAERPMRLEGVAVLTDTASFVAHANRFKLPTSAIFADRTGVKLQAVYDYHDKESPRWAKHRAAYACPLSRQWRTWLEKNEKPFGQEEFGTFIDDNMADLAAANPGDEFPAPMAVLEMARNLVVRSKGTFERKVNVTTGESTLVTKDEHEQESTKIPRAFLIGIPVFENGEKWSIEARLRFSMPNGRPSFQFSLYQHLQVLENAFGEVCEKVQKGTELPLFYGQPE